MPNLPLILVVAGVGILALFFLTGGRHGNERRRRNIPDSELVIRPGYTGLGTGIPHGTEYHTELLIQPRGRRRVVRAIKPRGQRDRTLEGDEPADPA